jgi:hypothetical protein
MNITGISMALARSPKGAQKFSRGADIVLSILLITVVAFTWLWIIFSIGITTGFIILGSIGLIIITSYIVGNIVDL